MDTMGVTEKVAIIEKHKEVRVEAPPMQLPRFTCSTIAPLQLPCTLTPLRMHLCIAQVFGQAPFDGAEDADDFRSDFQTTKNNTYSENIHK
jgi:hypothetical protein